MLQRLRKWMGQRSQAPNDSTIFRVCRLRHATLHPGATLWTPGVGGGNLGAAAEGVLDGVRDGGAHNGDQIIVAFQSRAREPIHPLGVLARVLDSTPFDGGIDPTGLGASKRFLLLGVAPIRIDLNSCTQKRLPTASGEVLALRPEEMAAPNDELVAALQALSRVDSVWPEHWLEAFEQLPHAPLGQWATTLGWRLSGEERIDLIDNPGRIGAVLLSALQGMDTDRPPAPRAAVRAQTITRRTTRPPDTLREVTPDELGWALYHPADLSAQGPHAEPSVSATTSVDGNTTSADGNTTSVDGDTTSVDGNRAEGDRWGEHFRRGHMVAVQGRGGPARVRLTVGALTEAEVDRAVGSTMFRLDVQHGRLFFGGAAMALRNQFQDNLAYADPGQWVDVPAGQYEATVTALKPTHLDADPGGDDEPSGHAEQEAQDVDADGFDYVISLAPVESLELLPAATGPADL